MNTLTKTVFILLTLSYTLSNDCTKPTVTEKIKKNVCIGSGISASILLGSVTRNYPLLTSIPFSVLAGLSSFELCRHLTFTPYPQTLVKTVNEPTVIKKEK